MTLESLSSRCSGDAFRKPKHVEVFAECGLEASQTLERHETAVAGDGSGDCGRNDRPADDAILPMHIGCDVNDVADARMDRSQRASAERDLIHCPWRAPFQDDGLDRALHLI